MHPYSANSVNSWQLSPFPWQLSKKSCNISFDICSKNIPFSRFQIHLKISKSLAIFDLFPQPLLEFSTCDRLISLSCLRPPFSSPCWTFPMVPVLPEVVPASLFYYPPSKKEVHRNQDVPKDVQRK